MRTTKKTLTEAGVDSVKKYMIPSGAVCVSCIGSVGKVALTTAESVTNQQINSIIVNNDLYDTDFVYYTMTILGKQLNYDSKFSSVVPIINKGNFSNYTIMCPELDEQKRIASILS